MSMLFVFEPEMATQVLIEGHRLALREKNNLNFIKRQAKVIFQVSDEEFNQWYLHFLKLYWKEVDDVKRT